MTDRAFTPDEVTLWSSIPAAVAADASAGQGVVRDLVPLRRGGLRIFGLARVVACLPPDFGAVPRAVAAVRAGEVLLVDAGGNLRHAVLGGLLGGHLLRAGAGGVVVDGAVRDSDELLEMGLHVISRGVTPLGPTSATGGTIGGEVTIGGVRARDGDLVIGDSDGVVILSPSLAREVLAAAQAKAARDIARAEALASGRPLAEVYGF